MVTRTVPIDVEVELIEGHPSAIGCRMFHVKHDYGLDVFLFYSAEAADWIATAPARGFHGCRVPRRWRADLPAIVVAAFPELQIEAGAA